MTALTATEIRAAALSVAGARGMGITTAASLAAPALLERAEAELSSMAARAASLGPSAPDQADERRYCAAASQAAAYLAAIDELRAALGLETHAARLAAEKAAKAATARADREQREADEAATQVRRTADCDTTEAQYGRVVDARGHRVAVVNRSSYSEGRMSSLGGWNAGGDLIGMSARMIAEDGRDVTGEIVATPDGEFRLEQPYSRSYPNGGETWHGGGLKPVVPTATSEWLPAGAVIPEYRSEWSVEAAWQAADQGKDDQAMLARLSAMAESWLQERATLVEKFTANPDATHGGWNGGKYSVRRDLMADLEAAEAAYLAEKAEKSARMAASPFAALAARFSAA